MSEKTIEERFLKMYDEVTDRNVYLELKVKELQQKIDEMQQKEPQEEKDYIYLTNTPNYYWSVDLEIAYSWNEILKYNKKKPTLVEKAKKDEKSFYQLCNLKQESYWRGKLAEIKEKKYDYLFKDRKGRRYVIVLNEDDSDMYMIDTDNNKFLSQEEADEYLRKRMAENIDRYITHYKDEFETKEND